MVSKSQDWLISSRNHLYHVYNEISFTEKRPSRPENFELKKWKTNFRLQHSFRKNRTTFQMFYCSCKFSAGSTQTVAFQLLSNRIFRKLFVNGKQPKFANTYSSSFDKIYIINVCCEDITVATESKEVTMVASAHNLQLSSLKIMKCS